MACTPRCRPSCSSPKDQRCRASAEAAPALPNSFDYRPSPSISSLRPSDHSMASVPRSCHKFLSSQRDDHVRCMQHVVPVHQTIRPPAHPKAATGLFFHNLNLVHRRSFVLANQIIDGKRTPKAAPNLLHNVSISSVASNLSSQPARRRRPHLEGVTDLYITVSPPSQLLGCTP